MYPSLLHHRGQALVEYVSLTVFMAIGLIFVMTALGSELSDTYEQITTCFKDSYDCRTETEPVSYPPSNIDGTSSEHEPSTDSSSDSSGASVSNDTSTDSSGNTSSDTSTSVNSDTSGLTENTTPEEILDIVYNYDDDNDNDEAATSDDSNSQCLSDITFDEFISETVISNQINGVTISSLTGSLNPPMIFDNSSMSTSVGGKSLVVALANILGSGYSMSPVGGQFTFEFDEPVNIGYLTFVDTGILNVATVQLFDESSVTLNLVYADATVNTIDAGLIRTDIDTENVSKMVVSIASTGALDGIYFCSGESDDTFINVDAEINVSPEEPLDPEKRVSNMETSVQDFGGSNWRMSVWVTVVDQDGNPVNNATLNGGFATGNGGYGGYSQCTTDAQGRCEVTSNTVDGNSVTQMTFNLNSVWGGQHREFNSSNSVMSVMVER